MRRRVASMRVLRQREAAARRPHRTERRPAVSFDRVRTTCEWRAPPTADAAAREPSAGLRRFCSFR